MADLIYKARLMPQDMAINQIAWGAPNTGRLQYVTFKVTPDVSESRSVNYNAIDPVHLPGQIMVYRNTSSRTFGVSNIRLISRTPEEAEENLQTIWLLKAWTMPRFGNSSTLSENSEQARNRKQDATFQRNNRFATEEVQAERLRRYGREMIGAPPPVLLFSLYSKQPAGTMKQEGGSGPILGHINNVPVVITSLGIPYPSDVDYILSAESQVPMPLIMTIDVQLTETHSPREYEKFSLDDYRSGRLSNF